MTIQMMAQQPPADWSGRELLDADFDALGDADDYGPWVDAAPFRAHVRHLVEATGVPWRTIAVLADVPSQSVDHLLRGRKGRIVPRLHPLIAERLFSLTRDAVVDASSRRVHAGRTKVLLNRLVGRGWEVDEIARRANLPPQALAAIAEGAEPACSQLVAATVKAAAQALWDRRLRTRPLRVPAPADRAMADRAMPDRAMADRAMADRAIAEPAADRAPALAAA